MSPNSIYGYAGKILWLDLTKREAKKLELSREMARDYIGARGFGIKILWDNMKKGTDPLSPESLLVVSVGPLAGTSSQSASRWFVAFKSPLTGTYFRSVGGGYFGAEMKFAGYDAIVVSGRAEKPTYVWIKDDNVEFRDATRAWGLTTDMTTELLKEETDKSARLITIGPAGERLVKISSIQSDDQRSAGRGGGGAVLGAKNLKAIVVKGSKMPKLFDEERFREAVKEEIQTYQKSPALEGFRALGTAGVVDLFYSLGHNPSFNFMQREFNGIDNYKADVFPRYIIKRGGCYGCMISCWQFLKTTDGPYAGFFWDKPEYEALWSFGSNLGNANLEAVMQANMLCDKYGLDVISVGSAIGMAYELYEKGILTRKETDGMELRWGDPEPALEIIRKIALREGIGRILGEGTKRAAEIIGRGAEKYAIQIKGLELPAYDPRAAKAHGLSLVTSNIGASHNMGWNYFEITGVPKDGKQVDPLSIEGKGELTKYVQDETAMYEVAGKCTFPADFVMFTRENLAKLLYYATGIEEFKNPDYLMLVGERVYNLERAFNVREGFGREHDTIPERFVKEPFPRTPAKGQVFELDKLLDDYYKARGWDLKTGKPTKAKLESLGLNDVAKEINAE
ncbi:aldehyde ferredoxin oxidoreductase family protein [Fervidicoccus fontis]|uniref:Aldehyde ferredoxin oxidoreductase family protein n=1 Tax=Fervidicoccus fontis TaxID=683846 RepID=A0A843ABK1_9CREN|nr:aldehyde ferredoxin oxidoreductase family protein [Fervidicoccus fontis]MBE9391202.1 aldehyde ferredoxin oxidoreductase family protein [Fervidicoccus fontis]